MPTPTLPGVTERRITVRDGVELNVLEAGTEGPLVVLAHGFPELAYSWRHQLLPLAEAGYRVVAPDQRGYGQSTAPADVDAYDIIELTDDLLGLLDHYGEDEAVFIGHDWGSMVVWQMALLHPERVTGVVGMSVPFSPRSPVSPLTLMRSVFGDSFFYILYFQEYGVADADLAKDPAATMRRMLCGVKMEPGAEPDPALFAANDGRGFVERMPEPDALPDWLTQDELDHYIAEFSRTGFTGGINWYRNFDRNWERTPQLDGAKIEVPATFVGGTADPVLVMSPPAGQEANITDFRGSTLVDGAGHWVQQEAPEQVNAALLGFLDSLREGNTTS